LLRLLIVAALLGYVWLLVKIAKPRPITQPVTESKVWLVTQIVIAWLCVSLSVVLFATVKWLGFGFLTLLTLGAKSSRQPFQSSNPGDTVIGVGYFLAWLFVALGVPLLVAISVRWTRKVLRKWKALRLPPAVEASTVHVMPR
jgi:hypothetical protein